MSSIRYIAILLLSVLSMKVLAQSGGYVELPDPMPNASSWNNVKQGTYVSFASPDIRFKKTEAPNLAKLQDKWVVKAWKGEKVHTQVLVWTTTNLEEVKLRLTELEDKSSNVIDISNLQANFVRYVITDGLSDAGIGCGITPKKDSSLVSDVIDHHASKLTVNAKEVRPVWLSIHIPSQTAAGNYTGFLEVLNGTKILKKLQVTLEVLNRTLPEPSQWAYHLDLWQNPYATARINAVTPWSDAHMEALKPEMQRLANAGQKAITASIIHDPWNSQTYDIYQSMIKWVKKKDGTWAYNYTNFDKWVSFMMGLGIDRYINCYSMIPWNLKFYYYDEATGKEEVVVAKPGTAAYNDHWKPMLKDFARHLKQKGWFERTTIAMDEREMEDMKKAIALIKSADPDFKVSLAGNYHEEIEADLVDYSVASNQKFDADLLNKRNQKNFNTTFYTCCAEGYPNTYTFSPPAEAAWLAWHAANKGYGGYLRWAYNCYNKEPLKDTRFGAWSAGDTYIVYPGNRTSIRFERLIEGIQDFEKLRILKAEFSQDKDAVKLTQLEQLTKPFEIDALKQIPAANMVNKAREQLNNF
jgi:hypothetical protein